MLERMRLDVFDLERFLNIRSASAPTVSPDGQHVAYLSDATGVYQLWQGPSEGHAPTQLTFTHETVRGGWYSPRRSELIFAMDEGGNERSQLYWLHGIGESTASLLAGGWDWTPLSHQPEAIHQFGGWSHDGQRIAFSANRTLEGRFDVYTQALGGKPRLLQEGPGGFYETEGWSPDDRFLLVSRGESSVNQDLYVIDVATGEARHITPHARETSYRSPRWSADGQLVYCLSTWERDFSALAQIDLATGRLSYVETAANEIVAVEVSPQGRWVAWVVNVDGRSELYLREVSTGRSLTPPELSFGVITEMAFSRDEKHLVFAFNGPRYNSDIWGWNLSSNVLRQLTHSSQAGIPFSSFREPELIRYKTFDGRLIPAWFYAPPSHGDQLPPVILHVHGGPEAEARPIFTALFQYFLQYGYAILAPNVRGSRGFGTTYMNLDNTTRRMDAVKDLAHAVYWLRDQRKGDPARIAVYGGSYGGFMSLAAVTHYPELFAAGIDVCGTSNWVTFLEHTGSYRRAHREAEYGNLRDHRAFLEEISPIHHVDRIRCPMMVIHGANDPRVPIGEAEQIVSALRRRKVPVEYLRYEDEGHGLWKHKNRLDAYPKLVAFLNKFVAEPRIGAGDG